MIRMLFYSIVLTLLVRALLRFWGGLVEGLRGPSGQTASGTQRPVQMVRDPVCGTFVLPDRSVRLAIGGDVIHFCSTSCRDKFSAKPSTSSGRPEQVEGRTA